MRGFNSIVCSRKPGPYNGPVEYGVILLACRTVSEARPNVPGIATPFLRSHLPVFVDSSHLAGFRHDPPYVLSGCRQNLAPYQGLRMCCCISRATMHRGSAGVSLKSEAVNEYEHTFSEEPNYASVPRNLDLGGSAARQDHRPTAGMFSLTASDPMTKSIRAQKFW